MKTNVHVRPHINTLLKSIALAMIFSINIAAMAQNTVVDVIVGSPDHNTLEAAVIAAQLDDDLAGDGPFTVFAPTDAAFEALPEGTVESLLQDPTGELARILLYHVVGASAMSSDLENGQMITTLNGDSITVKIMDNMVYIDQAMVTTADIATDNGVVHVIDAVIIPNSTVVDVIVGSPDHNTLEAAVIAAQLDDDLAGDGPFTVFAPTDAAFEALPEGTVESLLQDPTGELARILLYHVVSASAMSSDLENGQMITTLLGEPITINVEASGVVINDANLIISDIITDNGIVHIIDAVITPATGIKQNTIDNNIHIYPNPASENLTIEFKLEDRSDIIVSFYDITGRKVYEEYFGAFNAGQQQVAVNVNSVSPGFYMVMIDAGRLKFANRLRVVR